MKKVDVLADGSPEIKVKADELNKRFKASTYINQGAKNILKVVQVFRTKGNAAVHPPSLEPEFMVQLTWPTLDPIGGESAVQDDELNKKKKEHYHHQQASQLVS
uniref:Uncharacterized protein n=1 Tax=Oryza brachyantha TaxID=4533 RepID=J3MFN2_ORYBR